MADFSQVRFRIYLNMSTIKQYIYQYYCLDIQGAVTLQTGKVFSDSPGISAGYAKLKFRLFKILFQEDYGIDWNESN